MLWRWSCSYWLPSYSEGKASYSTVLLLSLFKVLCLTYRYRATDSESYYIFQRQCICQQRQHLHHFIYVGYFLLSAVLYISLFNKVHIPSVSGNRVTAAAEPTKRWHVFIHPCLAGPCHWVCPIHHRSQMEIHKLAVSSIFLRRRKPWKYRGKHFCNW